MPLPRDHAAASVFRPEHLLREARRQRGLPDTPVPALCVLDPDGDLVRYLRDHRDARPCPGWACYHTTLHAFALDDGTAIGVLGCAVGAPFAVLVAEQLFASGCTALVSITSSGRIADLGPPPYVVVIDAALRDEGTSGHYLPPGAPDLLPAPGQPWLGRIQARLEQGPVPVHRGATWTTDAPYRETQAAIDAAGARGLLAVEMEAAALYAFATATGHQVACLAHVTNTMGQHGGDDFEKGEAGGAHTALRIIEAASHTLHPATTGAPA